MPLHLCRRRRCHLCCRRHTSPPATPALPAGEKLALDDLGPLIVTADGSLRRIANWQGLTEAERRTALRRLAKRNKQRLATLEEQQQAQAQQGGQLDREL